MRCAHWDCDYWRESLPRKRRLIAPDFINGRFGRPYSLQKYALSQNRARNYGK